MEMRVLVTGGAGFIGNNFIRYVLNHHPQWKITNLDKLTYAGNLDSLTDADGRPGYSFVKGDIADRGLVNSLFERGFDMVVNFAAESHVDRSILDPSPFVDTNIRGTQVLLETAKTFGISRFIQVSTDEVYGSLKDDGRFVESSCLLPNNPYSASKASADLLCRAYHQTYGLPVIITRGCNNFGPYQFPEKLIPLTVIKALENRGIPLYGDGRNVRDWLYTEDYCRAIDLVMDRGAVGGIYNVSANCEWTNLELVQKILGIMGKPLDLIEFVADRPGHDWRYALTADKITNELGWQPVHGFDDALRHTVQWYLQNEPWWRRLHR